ncbi:MAG: 4-alpha-glucanotransferase [Clostridia bacterium]|nr:4-alpha-glucanotransferase [Clostridia bacterium]
MRKAGILLPVFSLPSEYGIGSIGRHAYDFIDLLTKCGQKYWQILPTTQTGYGDSPYQSPSAFAGNPYFIDLETLCAEGLLTKDELKSAKKPQDYIDYGALFSERYALLKSAFARFMCDLPDDYTQFTDRESYWLDDYALFMAIKEANGYASWLEWPEELKLRTDMDAIRAEYADRADFWKFVQYKFDEQFTVMHSYASSAGVSIIGDMPIYVSTDSADVWANRAVFCLNEHGRPTEVAGVPPDYFSKSGQLWGNPLYDWDYAKKTDYAWWKLRLKKAFSMFDRVRIDHFRGFYDYYSIPYGAHDATIGKWKAGPGIEFFNNLKKHFGQTPIIAEDLGDLSEGVYEMLRQTGFPGMKVLQFAFDSDNSIYLPKNTTGNYIVYTGTHDNMTLRAWLKNLSPATKARIDANISRKKGETYRDAIIGAALNTVADTVIIPMQDWLGLGDEARMNTPSVSADNWRWKLHTGYRTDRLVNKIRRATEISGR